MTQLASETIIAVINVTTCLGGDWAGVGGSKIECKLTVLSLAKAGAELWNINKYVRYSNVIFLGLYLIPCLLILCLEIIISPPLLLVYTLFSCCHAQLSPSSSFSWLG